MKHKKTPTLKIKLLKRLRAEAYRRIGVIKFSDKKYRIVLDKLTSRRGLSKFNEYSWHLYQDEYSYLVVEREDDVCDTLEEAKIICDDYRRLYILREVRKLRTGNVNRYY